MKGRFVNSSLFILSDSYRDEEFMEAHSRPYGRALSRAKTVLFQGFIVTLVGGFLFLFGMGAFGNFVIPEPKVFVGVGLVVLLLGLRTCFYGLVESGLWRPKEYAATERYILPGRGNMYIVSAWIVAAILGLFVVELWRGFPISGLMDNDKVIWKLFLTFVIFSLPPAGVFCYSIWETLGFLRFGNIPLILLSVPVRLGGRLEGFLSFPGRRAPKKLTARLLYTDVYAKKVLSEQICRPNSTGEMLRFIGERSPSQIEEVSAMLNDYNAQVPIAFEIPSTAPLTQVFGGVGLESRDVPERNIGHGFWSVKVTTRLIGINVSRTYPITILA